MKANETARSESCSKQAGNALLFCLMILTLLSGITLTQFTVVQKSSQQSRFFCSMGLLREYGESGIGLSLHDLSYSITGNEGKIGTRNWTAANDLGRDGLAGTLDEGEGDGIPTPGEPNVIPERVGSAELNAELIVYTEDTSTPQVKRIVATAFNDDASVTLEMHTKKKVYSLPRTGALWLPPTAALDLKGGSFRIDGNDQNFDGSPGTDGAVYGIGTTEGAIAGENTAGLVAQIDPNHYDQILGQGASPSIGEEAAFDFNALFESLKTAKTNELTPGTYTDVQLGDASVGAYNVTYVNGDVALSGGGGGAGILLVEGALSMSGQFEFRGLVIVKGDAILMGGGNKKQICGALLVGQSVTTDDGATTIAGNVKIAYSSAELARAFQEISGKYSAFYYRER